VTTTGPKVLTVDIETSPNLAYAWGLWDQNISLTQLIEPSRVLCFAAKWLGKRKVEYYSEYHHTHEEMVQQAWRLYNEADVVVTYNGVRFDNQHLMREFILADLGPPSPHLDIDLLQTTRKQFKFMSNKLGYITKALDMPSKLETGGQELWNQVMLGDSVAWERFKRYNIQDVRITEQLYLLLQPWINGPHHGLWSGVKTACHSCGGADLVLDGVSYTKTNKYPRVRCACGAWSKVLRNGETRAA